MSALKFIFFTEKIQKIACFLQVHSLKLTLGYFNQNISCVFLPAFFRCFIHILNTPRLLLYEDEIMLMQIYL